MKRVLMILLLLLGISFLPVNDQFSAQAGRQVMGGAASEWCDCGPSCLTCYDETTWQQCNYPPSGDPNCISGRAAEPSKGDDLGSIAMLGLAALYLLKRFI